MFKSSCKARVSYANGLGRIRRGKGMDEIRGKLKATLIVPLKKVVDGTHFFLD